MTGYRIDYNRLQRITDYYRRSYRLVVSGNRHNRKNRKNRKNIQSTSDSHALSSLNSARMKELQDKREGTMEISVSVRRPPDQQSPITWPSSPSSHHHHLHHHHHHRHHHHHHHHHCRHHYHVLLLYYYFYYYFYYTTPHHLLDYQIVTLTSCCTRTTSNRITMNPLMKMRMRVLCGCTVGCQKVSIRSPGSKCQRPPHPYSVRSHNMEGIDNDPKRPKTTQNDPK